MSMHSIAVKQQEIKKMWDLEKFNRHIVGEEEIRKFDVLKKLNKKLKRGKIEFI